MGLDTVELLMSIEDHFGIAIPNDEAAEIVTVQDMANVVAQHLGKPANAEILSEVITIISDKTGIAREKILPEHSFTGDLGMD